MSSLSFRRGSSNVLPRVAGLTLAGLAAAALLGGCGGPPKPTSRSVAGDGFVFQAPLAWRVTRTSTAAAAVHGAIDRVEVIRFGLVKPYRPALFEATARELDVVTARLAKELFGRVTRGVTLRVAGRASRSYRLVYRGTRSLEIAFVLKGETEYELLCRRLVSDPDDACRELFQSFTLASG